MAACSKSDDKVSVLETHLEDPGYILWVQAGTCLGFLKTFFEQLAVEVSASLHKSVMRNLHVCVQKQNNPAKMKMCNHSDISFKRALNKWTISCCTNCQCYVDQLVKLTEPPFKFRQSNWDNSNIPLWPTDPWEKAKVYMNYGQTISQRSPQDTDLSGILNFIDNCSLSQCWWKIEHKLKRKKKTAKVRDSRNAVMHSAAFKLAQQDFKKHTSALRDFLQDFLAHPTLAAAAQDADSRIKEVQSSPFVITTDAEYRAIRDRALELQEQNKEVQRSMDEIQKQYSLLKGKKTKHSQRTIQQLVLQTGEQEAELKELDAVFSSLKLIMSGNPELSEKTNDFMTKTFTALNETRLKMTEIRTNHRCTEKKANDHIEDRIKLLHQRSESRQEYLNQRIETLLEEKKALKVEGNVDKIQNELLQMQLDDTKKECQCLRTVNNTLLKNVNELRLEVRGIQTERDTIKTKFEKVVDESSKLDDIKANLVTANHELHLAQILNDDLMMTNKQIKEEIKCTKTDYYEGVKEMFSAKVTIDKLTSQIDKLREELCEMHSENESFKAEIIKIRKERDTISEELCHVQDNNDQLKLKLSQQEESAMINQETVDAMGKLHSISEQNNIIEREKNRLVNKLIKMKSEQDVIVDVIKQRIKALRRLYC